MSAFVFGLGQEMRGASLPKMTDEERKRRRIANTIYNLRGTKHPHAPKTEEEILAAAEASRHPRTVK